MATETPDGQILYNFIPVRTDTFNAKRVGGLLYAKEGK